MKMIKIPEHIGWEYGDTKAQRIILPEDAVTQGFALMGKRGRGKSVAFADIIETIASRGQKFCIMDPPDAHWGIRYAVDSHGKPSGPSGIDCLLVGGEHGDVPLDAEGGAALARIVVEADISVVISLIELGYTKQQKFAADFQDELFLRNRTPRIIGWEEAHNFLPQNLKFEEQKRVLYSSEKIVQEGRGKGLGYILASQRPAGVSKMILEQTDNFIALGMIGPNDLDQVENWLKYHVKRDKEKLHGMVDELASMEMGQAWFLSPVWMKTLCKIQFRNRTTYHAGRTPEPGEKPVNLKKISMGDAVEKLKKLFAEKQVARQREETDLKEANRKIKDLEVKLRKGEKAQPQVKAEPVDHTQCKKDLKKLEAGSNKFYLDAFLAAQKLFLKEIQSYKWPTFLSYLADAAHYAAGPKKLSTEMETPRYAVTKPVERNKPQGGDTATSEELTGPDLKIMQSIRQWEKVDPSEALKGGGYEKNKVAAWAGYAPDGGAFKNPLGKLNRLGLIKYLPGEKLALTDQGAWIVKDTPYPEAQQKRSLILDRLPGPERKIFTALLSEREATRERIGELSGYAITGGSFKNPLGTLRGLGLIEYVDGGKLKVSEWVYVL